MKRKLTPEQLMELTNEQQDKLRDIWEPKRGDALWQEVNQIL